MRSILEVVGMEASKEAAIETCETVEDISKTVEDFSKKPNLMSELSILYFWPNIHFFIFYFIFL